MSTPFALSAVALALSAFAVAAPVLAQPSAGPTIEVRYSAEMTEKLEDDYGLREQRELERSVERSLRRELPAQVARVDVEIVDAVPNRPTFQQLGKKPGLSFASFGLGGAELRGRAFDASGNLLAETTYDWYGMDIDWAAHAAIWDDADRAINRFAQELADEIGS